MAKTQPKVLLMFVCILGSQAAKVAYGQCLAFLGNTVVYEGTENAILSCGLGPNGERWTVRPTSNAIKEFQITNFTDTVSPTLTGLYAVNQSGLIIRNATIDPTGGPISTAGIYYVYFADGNTALAKLVVIRSGPTCSWTRSASGGTSITCTIIYADHPVSPMNATITCTADGRVYTATPTKTLIKPSLYLYDSTTVITFSNSSAETYDCRAAFTAPVDNRTSNLARNEPNFTANVTALETKTQEATTTGDQCLRKLRNMAVYEGQQNTVMNLSADPKNVSWKVTPTSDEFSTYDIINIGGYRDPSLANLYEVNQNGLVIKEATTTRGKNGNPISTAGLYIGECANNAMRTGAKLLVIRTGPQCLINSSSVSCNVTFADFTLHAMYPIITWKLNGAYLTSYTLRTEKIYPDVFYAESTISIISGAPNNYRCELTFAAPSNVEYPWIAKNAPKFKKSCSIRG